MALSAPPPDSFSLDRWNQPSSAQEYIVMDGLMQYDTRPLGHVSPQHQRAPISHSYLGPTYSAAPIASLTSSPFAAHNSFPFSGYDPPPLRESYSHPSRPPFPDRHVHVSMRPMNDILAPPPRDVRPPFDEQGQSPSAGSDPSQKTLTVPDGELPKVPRTITANATVNPQDEVSFSTHVDTVMRAIQANTETGDVIKVAEDRTRRGSDDLSSVGYSTHSSPSRQGHGLTTDEEQTVSSDSCVSMSLKKRRIISKRHICDFRGCSKRFSQKTHLDIHRRVHTGERPYACEHPGCGKRFGQQGNLRTHQRTHTGERPYECAVCGRMFPQRGNVRAHQASVHREVKPFVCKLEACTKEFTTRGNLKTHHNKFHKEALVAFGQKFATIRDTTGLSPTDREIWEHLATTYKNSNKGIKGRGKKGAGSACSQSPDSATLSPFPIDIPQGPLHHQGYTGDHDTSPSSSFSSGSSVGFPSPTGHNPAMLETHMGSGMYDAKVGGEMMGPSTSGALYDPHVRDVVFHDRGYDRAY